MSMTIEEIKDHLNAIFYDDLDYTAMNVDKIMYSIAAIRTKAYNQGWKDAEREADDSALPH